jgi:hypothetical protein
MIRMYLPISLYSKSLIEQYKYKPNDEQELNGRSDRTHHNLFGKQLDCSL